MKKFLLTAVCAIGCSSLFADTDSYLFWMIGDNPYVYGAGGKVENLSGYTAKVYVEGQPDNLLSLYYTPESGTPISQPAQPVAATAAQGFGLYASVAGLDTTASILVELLNGSGAFAGIANLGTVGELSSYIASFSGMDTPVLDPKTISSFTIPEPTSGLLLLFGCAALALRRRKMIKA